MAEQPDGARGLEPTIRQPAPQLGPRAQRTIERILDATREIFLTRGYGGTSIDDITQLAGVSRASFYTYFPTKRDALLALGNGATQAARATLRELEQLPDDWTSADLEAWMHRALAFLNDYGSFGVAWSQAAYEDDELRTAGMKTHLATCQQFGATLDKLRGTSLGDGTQQGLLAFGMLERGWMQYKLYEPALTEADFAENGAALLAAMLTPPG